MGFKGVCDNSNDLLTVNTPEKFNSLGKFATERHNFTPLCSRHILIQHIVKPIKTYEKPVKPMKPNIEAYDLLTL